MSSAPALPVSDTEHVSAWAEKESQPAKVHQLSCVGCGSRSGLLAGGWRGCRTDEPESGEKPSVAFFCPTCSARKRDAKSR
jgi:hypothetical protein